MVMSMDDLYEKAHAFYEAEDNYSNRTIVAVIKDESFPPTENKFVWGVMHVEDDPDPEAELPNFYIKGQGLTEDEAVKAAHKYYDNL